MKHALFGGNYELFGRRLESGVNHPGRRPHMVRDGQHLLAALRMRYYLCAGVVGESIQYLLERYVLVDVAVTVPGDDPFVDLPLDISGEVAVGYESVSYTHLRAHETRHELVCRLLLEKKKKTK